MTRSERDHQLRLLSARELRVSVLVGLGLPDGRIAGVIGCPPSAVEAAICRVLAKLDLRSRTDLATLVRLDANLSRLLTRDGRPNLCSAMDHHRSGPVAPGPA